MSFQKEKLFMVKEAANISGLSPKKTQLKGSQDLDLKELFIMLTNRQNQPTTLDC